MPNYEFRCQSCQKKFLKSLPFGSKELPACPVCMGTTKRLLSPPMIHFKGSGFYKTDSAVKPKKESTQTTEKATTAKPTETSTAPGGEPGRTTHGESGRTTRGEPSRTTAPKLP